MESNYVMHYKFNGEYFQFAASIGQCMNEYFDSDTYIKYQCINNETAVFNKA